MVLLEVQKKNRKQKPEGRKEKLGKTKAFIKMCSILLQNNYIYQRTIS